MTHKVDDAAARSHDQARAAPPAVAADDSDVEAGAGIDPEDAETEVAPRRAGARQATGEFDAHTSPTAELSREQVAQQVAASFLRDSIEISGEEAEQARRLTEMLRTGEPTKEIDPRALPRLTHECRMCGEKVTAPAARRFGMPELAGFRCVRCGNVYCAAHVVRVSGFFETLLHGARFSCQLCLPESQRERDA